MKDKNRQIRKEKIAKLLYELGLDYELVSKISGIDINKMNVEKKRNNKDLTKFNR